MTRLRSFGLKIRGLAFVLAVVSATVFVVYYFASAANTTIGNNISTSGTLTVGGRSLLSGIVNASSTLQVSATSTFYAGLGVGGTTSPAATLGVAGLVYVGGTGTSTVEDDFEILGNLRVGGLCLSCGGASSGGGWLDSGSTISLLTDTDLVGVGTSTPSQKLSVQGNALFSGNITSVANITATGTLTVSGTASSSIATALGVASTSPWGTFSVEMGTVNPAFVISNNGSSSPSLFVAGVNQNGYVGVGTSTPAEALSVVGNISNIFATSSADNFPKFRGSAGTGADPYSVYISGRYAYVINFTSNTLQIFDVSTSSPALVGSVSTGSGSGTSPNSLYVSGNYAYVATFSASGGALLIFDVSDVSSPVLISSINAGGSSARYVDVKVAGPFAYVNDANLGKLLIFNISNPKNPVLINSTSYRAAGDDNGYIAISGRYLYLTDNDGNRLLKYDISTSTPAQVGFSGTDSKPVGVYVSGNYAYVVNNTSNTLQVFSIATSSPALVSTVTTGTAPSAVQVSGRYAYVTNYSSASTLQVFDVSNPLSPFSAGTISTNAGAWGLYVAGRYAYVTSDTTGSSASTLEIFDISGIETTSAMIHSLEAGNLQVRNDILAQGYLTAGSITAGLGGILSNGFLSVSGTSTFVGPIIGNLQNLVGSTTPITQKSITSYNSGGLSVNAVYVAGRYAYLAHDHNNGLSDTFSIIDVSDPGNQSRIGSVTAGINAANLYVSGQYAYLAAGNGLSIYNISNPSAPSLVNSFTLNGTAKDVFVSGRTAYLITTSSDNLEVIDVSNPAKPVRSGLISTNSGPSALYVSGRYAYVVNTTANTIQKFDISTSTPALTGSASTGSAPNDVYVSGRYAYVANNTSNTLQIFDVSTSSPALTGTITAGNGTYAVYVSGRYAYVTNNGDSTLQIFDVSIPASPILVNTFRIVNPIDSSLQSPKGIYVAGRYAYVTTNAVYGLAIIDIGGLETNSAIIHSLEAGNLQVRNSVLVGGQLQITDSLNVGIGGIFSDGPLAINASTSKSIIVGGLIIGTSTPATTSPNFDQFAQSTAIIEATSSGSVPLTIRGSGLQSANLFQIQDLNNINLLAVSSGGRLGIGTSTPGTLFSVHGNALIAGTTTLANLVATGTLTINSTTATSSFANGIRLTAGCFQLADGNCAGSGGGLTVGGAVTSGTGNRVLYEDSGNLLAESANLTFNGVTLTTLNASTTGMFTIGTGFIASASSTIANSLNVSGPLSASSTLSVASLAKLDGAFISVGSSTIAGSLQISAPLSASSTLSVFGLTSLNTGFISSGSSTISNTLQIAGNLQASSTVSANTLFVVGNTGIGTTSPARLLSVQGNAILSGDLQLASLLATGTIGIGSTTPYARLSIQATSSTDATPLISVGSTSPNTNFFEISSFGSTTISNLVIGSLYFDENAGFNTLADMSVTSDATTGTVEGYKFLIDASTTLVIYAESNGSGGIRNQRVGIATSTPGFTLSVVGNVGLSGCINSATTTVDLGSVSCLDIAEIYFAGEDLEPGDLVALDLNNPIYLVKASSSQFLIGVISTNPAILFQGSEMLFGGGGILSSAYPKDSKVPLALTGRIPVKVNLEGGEIKIGDPITLSSVLGVGKKATTNSRIIGYALENYIEPTSRNNGEIMVFSNLSYWSPPEDNTSLITSVIDLVKQWLESLGVFIENGLVKLQNLVAEKITAKKLCAEDTCIDQTQLQAILNSAGNPSPASDPVPESDQDSAPIPAPVPEENNNPSTDNGSTTPEQ